MATATDFEGYFQSSLFPAWQRTFFEQVLLETLRTQSILVPFLAVNTDFRAKDTGVMTFTEVFDSAPNWNALAESDVWLTGSYLDSRTVTINIEIHGDILKFNDYTSAISYINSGDIPGLVRNKIGLNMVEYLDHLARQALLSHPTPVFAGGTQASRTAIGAADIFAPDYAELARVHLEELNIPGVMSPGDGEGQTIVCITTPRVIHDIRTAQNGPWLEVHNYHATGAKFRSEVGMWGGVRFIKSNRMHLRNYGAVQQQTTLSNATVVGQGAAATVDSVYAVGQAGSTRYVEIPDGDGANYSVGDYVTIHAQAVGAGNPPNETDGTQETVRIVAIDTGANPDRLTFDRPLLKPHAAGDFITKGIDLHASAFLGGPSCVFGIAENPHPINPPKFDDLMMVNRVGWRMFGKMQLWRPEWQELHFTAGSTT